MNYLVFHAWTGYTVGYLLNQPNQRTAYEIACQRWGGLSRVERGDPPFDWRDRQIDVR